MNQTTVTTPDQTVATTILAQLGGGRFLTMTGAKDLVGRPDGLGFRLPARFAKDGITHVRVTLTAADDYTVQFFAIRGVKVSDRGVVDGVYADNLQDVFARHTGLATRL